MRGRRGCVCMVVAFTTTCVSTLYFAIFSTNFTIVDRSGVRSGVSTLLYFAIFSTNFTVVDRRGVRSGFSTLLYFAIFRMISLASSNLPLLSNHLGLSGTKLKIIKENYLLI